jgi:NAD(P)-dependent dehydrogenase (short-subunit alcohol dehydrogenase family)
MSKMIIDTQPVKHVGTPEEVAEAYVFAMKCSYLTGQSICVDGGLTIV